MADSLLDPTQLRGRSALERVQRAAQILCHAVGLAAMAALVLCAVAILASPALAQSSPGAVFGSHFFKPRAGTPAPQSVKPRRVMANSITAPRKAPARGASRSLSDGAPETLCAIATEAAERKAGTPRNLLRAISLVESGRTIKGARVAWPWTINLEGDGYYFETRAEALAFAKAALSRGKRSFDVGCMQVNYRWHHKHFDSLEEMFDPMINAAYGAKFLTELYAETGEWLRAAGMYHSRTPKLSDRYRNRVSRVFAHARAQSNDLKAEKPTQKRPASRVIALTPAPTPLPEGAPSERVSTPPAPKKAASQSAPKPARQRSSWPRRRAAGPLIGLTHATEISPGGLALGRLSRTRETDGGLLRRAKPFF